LSTLTKVLICLLTLSSIFLCGIVVTYVANADNFKQQNQELRFQLQAAEQNQRSAQKTLEEKTAEFDQLAGQLKRQIAAIEIKVGDLETNLAEAERQKALLLQKTNSFAAIMDDFSKTNEKQGLLLKNTLDELNRYQAALIKEQREHEQKTTALTENMAIIAQLEAEKKQLVEEKTALQDKLDQLTQQFGKTVAAPVPVTQIKEKAQVVPPTIDIDLKGSIVTVDSKNSLVEISIGEAHGVKPEMRFHVIRGDKFICDIVILDVEPERAVGYLEFTEVTHEQPKVGDKISTNL